MSMAWEIFWFLVHHWYAVLWGIGVFIVWLRFGWRWAVIVASLGAASIFFQKGYEAGTDAVLRKANKDADKAIERARKVRDRANADNSDPNQVRKDDGYRRD
jgi:hypothetical protein